MHISVGCIRLLFVFRKLYRLNTFIDFNHS